MFGFAVTERDGAKQCDFKAMEMNFPPCQSAAVRRLVFIVLVLGSVTCREAPPQKSPAETPVPAAKPPEVLVGGCDAWFANNVCESKGPLKVWVEGDTPTQVRLPGWTVSEPTEVRGGFRVTLQPGPVGARGALTYGAGNIEITHVETTTTTPVLDALLEKMSTDELLELAPTLALDGRATVWNLARRRIREDHGLAQGLMATRSTLKWLTWTHRVLGDKAAEIRFQCLQSQAEAMAGRPSLARRALESMSVPLSADGTSRFFSNYHWGLLLRDSGAPQESVQKLLAANEVAARIGHDNFHRGATQVMLPMLHSAGLRHLAGKLEQGLLGQSTSLHCRSRAAILTNVAWSRLLYREGLLGRSTGGPAAIQALTSANQTTKYLQTALELSERCDGDSYNSLLNLAYDASQRGSLQETEAFLKRARNESKREKKSAFFSLLIGKLRLQQNRTDEARKIYSRLIESEQLQTIDRWKAITGLAESQIHQAPERALANFREANLLVEDIANQAALLSNQRDDVATTLRSSRGIVDLLANQGRVSEAWDTALRARRRLASARSAALYFASIREDLRDQVDAVRVKHRTARSHLHQLRSNLWAVAKDEERRARLNIAKQQRLVSDLMGDLLELIRQPTVAPTAQRPAAGHVSVMLFPGHDKWWVFARTHESIEAVAIATTSISPDLASIGLALERVLPRIESITDLLFLPTADASRIDLHFANVHGRPLGLQVPVAYSLDGYRQRPRPRPHATAVLLGDSAKHIATEVELNRIEASLVARGLSVTIPTGPRLEFHVLQDSLAKADIVHFAGHAESRNGPFENALRLGNSRWLTAGDILWSPLPGRRVVLAGCETAMNPGGRPGWTVAEAFLASGASEVLATTRKIKPKLANTMGLQAHAHAGPLSHRLLVAAQALHRDAPETDWAAFRVLVP